ncbi:anamorsin [Eucyclogobius newberryi]|uniref:anamorsin n=1 Tax=Eucyclogobius newberryi TaxID=166745 RepID=UPI003B5A6953
MLDPEAYLEIRPALGPMGPMDTCEAKVWDVALKPGDRVLLVWTQPSDPEVLGKMAADVQTAVGHRGKVSMENAERLVLSSHAASSFDWVLSSSRWDSHTAQGLCEMARVLRPGGQLQLQEPVPRRESVQTVEKLIAALKLSGFVSVTEVSPSEQDSVRTKALQGPCLSASKPNFEVGSSSQIKLSFGKTKRPEKAALDSNAAKMWTLSANDMADDNVDLLDSDALLDEEDLKKPEPTSLKAAVCGEGTVKKKKACKNCTCGLAEELDQESEAKPNGNLPKSACGSCYLGDAFRCASCPYLGMPAFKPGEKILLDSNTLTDA